MPKKPATPPAPPSSPGTMTRTIAPFAPLAIALLATRAIIPGSHTVPPEVGSAAAGAPVKCGEVSDFQQCHSEYPTGCSGSAGYDGYLNLLKNRDTPPNPAPQVVRYLTSPKDYAALETATPSDLSSKNHSQFQDQLAKLGEGQIFGLVGFLYYAKASGKESSNCELVGDDAVDYHIGIGFDSQLAPSKAVTGAALKKLEQNSVIVEMTPHYRFNFHPDWSVALVEGAIGKKVRVVGQLLIDSEHNLPSQNCGLPTANTNTCWRASTWELHPVMQFQVCNSGDCTATSGDWVDLDKQQ